MSDLLTLREDGTWKGVEYDKVEYGTTVSFLLYQKIIKNFQYIAPYLETMLPEEYSDSETVGQALHREWGNLMRLVLDRGVSGMRHFRVGNWSTAQIEFDSALKLALPPQSKILAGLALLKILRLQNDWSSFDKLSQTLKELDLSEVEALELEWENICAGCQQVSDYKSLGRAVSPKGTHRDGTYLTEAFLWAKNISSNKLEQKLPKISSLVKSQKVAKSDAGYFLTCALQIEKCYDTDIPLVS